VNSRLLAIILLSIPASLLAQAPDPGGPPVVVTSGRGTVQAVPDRGWITLTAESRASSPRDAQRRNADAMRPVMERLRGAGIPAEAIRTLGYDVQYEWDIVNNKRVGRGYVARNTIDVRVDAVDRIGEYLEIAANSGATSLGGVRFDFKDRGKLEREALRLAVADARAKADAAASGAGRTVDRILRIAEEGTGGEPVPMPRVALMRQAEGMTSDAPQISAGQADIVASVVMTAVLR
jgi:uncharacterized protein